MRILVAHSFYRQPGGEDRYVGELVNLLRQHHDVELATLNNAELGDGPSTALSMTYSARRVRQMQRMIGEFEPDLIHLHNIYPALGPAVHLAGRHAGVPIVMTVHNQRLRCPNGLMFTKGSLCNRCEGGAYFNSVIRECFDSRRQASAYGVGLWVHRFIMGLEKAVSMFIAPSQFMHSRLLAWGLAADRVETIPYFTEVTAPPTPPGAFGLYVGRLSAEKGVDTLIRALHLAGDPPFQVAGDGPARPSLEALAGSLNLSKTRFLGRVIPQKVPSLLGAARYLAIPSICEDNSPLAGLEAMAVGRPLLVTDRGGLPELAGDGCGLVCRSGDADDLAGKIRLLSDEGLCRQLGSEAQNFARVRFSAQTHKRLLDDTYARTLALPRPSRP